MYDELYPQFQDHLLRVRNVLSERTRPTRAELKVWRKDLEKSKYEECGTMLLRKEF